MNDLVAWLTEQLVEDERVATTLDDADDCAMNGLAVNQCGGYPCESYLAIGKARLLAEIEAKRRVLDNCAWAARDAQEGGDHLVRMLFEGRRLAYENVVRWLATPYADRPGYLEEWRP